VGESAEDWKIVAKLSIVIPSRNEPYLTKTITDIFANARGEMEVVVSLVGYWPSDWKEVADKYPNLHTIHHGEAIGMRAGINSAVASAKSRGAKFIMKLDAHCGVGEGFDETLKAECGEDWIVVPRRKRLNPETWTLTDTNKPDVDYHYLSFPDDPKDFGGKGLNGKIWPERSLVRKDILLDEEMSSQGSGWFMPIDYFYRLELMDEANYGKFWNEFQELGLKCWLSGGRVMVNKKTWYSHWHKGKSGRGYHLPESWLQQGATFTKNWIWNEAWDKQTKPFSWLIEHFAPVPSWPDNWEEMLYAQRKPRAVPVVGSDTVGDSGVDTGGIGESGLVIHSAAYGVDVDNKIDVTERVRSLVKNDSLDIVVNNSTLTPGQNPFRGKKKVLSVQYSYDGGEKQLLQRSEKDWLIIGQAQRDVPLLWKANADKRWSTIEVGPKDRIDSPEIKYEVHDSIGEHVHDFQEVEGQSVPECKCGAVPNYEEIAAKVDEVQRQPLSAPALNDYLIRKFSISPQRLRGPMPIELRDFHRNDLAQLFAELGFKRGAEIGVAEGNYSEVLLKANPECQLLLVDPWHAYSGNPQNKTKGKHEFAYNEVVRKTKDYPHVDIRQGYSMDVVGKIPYDALDFCYVDANHLFDECVMDIIEWSKRVRSGGIVSGDDYYELDQKRWVGGGVVEAVQAYVKAHRIPIWYTFSGHKSYDYMWVRP